MDKVNIGWIGLGTMGTPMSQRLIKAGYPVKVYNRHKEKETALTLSGATTAASPGLLLQQADVVLIMVSNDQAIWDIFIAADGLLSGQASGKMIINMSTVSPDISLIMECFCTEHGHYYLDAPVSGSLRQAEDGQLVIMVGGNKEAFEKVKPILSRLGKLALRVGNTGAGNAAKLAVNTLLAYHAYGLAEAVVLGQRNGIRTEDLLALVNNSALGNAFTNAKGGALLQNNYHALFALKHIVKDLGLARDYGLASPVAQVLAQSFRQAGETWGEQDIIAVIKQVGQY